MMLLGFSYSKESGISEDNGLLEVNNEKMKVVYSNNKRLNTTNNNSVTLSIVNKTDKLAFYSLELNEVNGTDCNDLYYVIDESEKKDFNGAMISLGELNEYGKMGDQATHTIKIGSKSNQALEFTIDVKNIQSNLLINVIRNSNDVYTSLNGNVRYYGENPNNYIKVDGEIKRIIGIVGDDIKVVGEPKGLGIYNTALGDYVTLDDYLGSFNVSDININNVLNYKSWLMGEKAYWILTDSSNLVNYVSKKKGIGTSTRYVSYYLRYVDTLDNKYVVSGGNGSIDSPYEVTYGGE